jgi:hypothetical protein
MPVKRKQDIAKVLSRATKSRSFILDSPRPARVDKRARTHTPGIQVATPMEQDPIEDDEPPVEIPVSFAPSFVAPPRSPQKEANNEAVTEGQHDSFLDTRLMSPQVASPPHRNMGNATGRLSKRFGVIRDAVKGDRIRFQSGQYPFSKTSLDTNDPRNRAKTYVDVTVLGESTGWDQRVTVLGYIHSLVVVSKESQPEENDPTSQFAWICLGYDTAREQKIGRGSQLRIYNAVPVRLTVPLTKADPENPSSSVKWIILSTELCEPYSSLLPKLPDAQTLLSQNASKCKE